MKIGGLATYFRRNKVERSSASSGGWHSGERVFKTVIGSENLFRSHVCRVSPTWSVRFDSRSAKHSVCWERGCSVIADENGLVRTNFCPCCFFNRLRSSYCLILSLFWPLPDTNWTPNWTPTGHQNGIGRVGPAAGVPDETLIACMPPPCARPYLPMSHFQLTTIKATVPTIADSTIIMTVVMTR